MARFMKADIDISIHAPREGCDVRTRSPSWWASDFNPRTPRGVRRLKSYLSLALDGEFQSTHPARGATLNPLPYEQDEAISIHAPREGCDLTASAVASPAAEFQSTHPARGATGLGRSSNPRLQDFNPRTPRGVRLRLLRINIQL